MSKPTYDDLSDEKREELAEKAEEMRTRMFTTNEAVIDLGRSLISIKDELEHGQFTEWVNRELRIEMRTVQNYMNAAKLVEACPDKSETISHLSPAVLYRLGAKSCPVEARDEVLSMKAPPSLQEVSNIIAQHRPPKPVRPDEKRQRIADELRDVFRPAIDDELQAKLQGHKIELLIDGKKFTFDLSERPAKRIAA